MFNRKLINTLKTVINNLEKENKDLKMKIEQRDIVLKDYQEEHEILLNNSAEHRQKITDLENNIEFLVNNLTPKKRELARPDNQN